MLGAQAGDASVLRDQDEPVGDSVIDDTPREQPLDCQARSDWMEGKQWKGRICSSSLM